MSLHIAGGHVLAPSGFDRADLVIEDARLAASPGRAAARTLDADGLLVLPGIVDLHGDAFERSLQPRPGVAFPAAFAVAEAESQLLAAGITTAFHALTLSWEPGLRGVTAWTAWLAALDAHRPRAACDMRVHLRWEAFALDALETALADIASGRVHLVSFNDHTPGIRAKLDDAAAAQKFLDRAMTNLPAFRAEADAAWARAADVPAARDRIAAAARDAGLVMASHDDATIADRAAWRGLGAAICEFPMAEAVAADARAHAEPVVMGAPNVVRGGSHLGWASAARLAEAGLCTVLASDYVWPALLHAPFVLAARGKLDLAAAWALVSANPAQAAGLHDRGRIAPGLRADLVLVAPDPAPRVVATIAGGRLVHAGPGCAERLDGPRAAAWAGRATMPDAAP